MKNADEFSKPYSQRSCPEGTVAEVWFAFVQWVESEPAERAQKWLDYMAIRNQYYDEHGNALPTNQ